jgi:hypothetical protein
MGHNLQALLSLGSAVRIGKYRRRVGGEFATWIDLFWREDEPWVVLQLPSGRRMAVPASWTDLPAGQFARVKDQPEILPSGLLELARYCQSLRGNRGKRRRLKKRLKDKKSC